VQTVAIVIQEGVQALDVAGPVDVFNEANAYIAEEDRYETSLVSINRAPLRASNRMQMVPDLAFNEVRGNFDIVLIAGGVTAGIDLALALVGQRHGPEVAVAVAKRLVVQASYEA
jgi:transcriptional regulator GlxA family with amidase domain